MKKANQYIEQFLKCGTLISTVGLIGVVSIQIFARFALTQAPSWTEEVARFFFVYAISFASGLAMKDKYFVFVDIFFNKMNAKWQSLFLMIISLSVILLFGLMTYYSLELIKIGHAERSSSTSIKMSFIFFSILIMSASIAYFALVQLRQDWKKYKQ